MRLDFGRIAGLGSGHVLALFLLALPPQAAQAQGGPMRLSPGSMEFEGTSDAAALSAELEAALAALLAPGGEFADCPAEIGGEGTREDEIILRGRVETRGKAEVLVLDVVRAADGAVLHAVSGAAAEALARGILARLCAPLPDPPADPDPGATVYSASGGGSGIAISGLVADPFKVFKLEGVFTGATAQFVFYPIGRGGGSVDYEFAGSGVTGSGDGVYALKPGPDGTYVIEAATDGCVHGVGTCASHTNRIVLTPIVP